MLRRAAWGVTLPLPHARAPASRDPAGVVAKGSRSSDDTGAVAIALLDLRVVGRRRARPPLAHHGQGVQLALEGDHRPLDLLADLQERLADQETLDQQLLDVVADAVMVDLGRRQRPRAADEPTHVGALVAGRLQAGVLLPQEHQLGADGLEALRIAGRLSVPVA